MSLVPHKIVALNENNEGAKNTIAGAVVSLFDSSGAAVTLFDDESGSNGSTTKQTDSQGAVVVWVTAGEYDEEVNGSVRRKVSVGGNSIVSYPDTASLQTSRPTKTGQRAENRERANAQYELAASGYTAQPGDIVAANGRVWELQVTDVINAAWFGLLSSNSDIENDSAISAFLSYFETFNTRSVTPEIQLPVGRFLFSSFEIGNRGSETGLLNGRLTIKGQGPLNTQLVSTSSTEDAIKVVSGRVNLKDFSLTSDGSNRSKTVGSGSGIVIDATDGSTPDAVTVAKFKFENIEVANQPNDGFRLVNTELLRGEGLTSEENGGYGFNFDGDNYGGDIKGISNFLLNTRAYRNSLDGYRVNLSTECTFVNPQALENDGDYQFWSNARGTKIINPDFESKTAASNLVGCLLAGDNSSIENGLIFGVQTGVILQGDGQKVDYVSFSNSGLGFNMTPAVNTTNATNYTVNVEAKDLSAKNVTQITQPLNPHDGGLQRIGGVMSTPALAPILNTFSITSNTPTAFGDNYGGVVNSASYNILLESNAVILVPTSFTNNQEFEIIFRQDGTGSRVVTFSGAQWVTSWSNTGNAANAVSSIKFKCIFDSHVGQNRFIQIGEQMAYV